MKDKILEVQNLTQIFKIPKSKEEQKSLKDKIFPTRKELHAVDGISFDIYEGETFGLVGESGSGKSTTGRSIIRLYDPISDKLEFLGKDISGKLDKETKKFVHNNMQMIFQDPFASINPRMTIENVIGEALILNRPELSKNERTEKIIELLETVGLSKSHLTRYPHEFSGGQLQRIGIARALAVKPRFIIADEAISALDVSIQAQVVNLMKKLQKDFGLTYLFIAHDLSMVRYISDRIGVMYKGRLVEVGTAHEIYDNPLHPYTKSLLSAVPHPDPIYEQERQRIIYDPKQHDYNENNQPEEHFITETHKVLCTEAELKEWTGK